MDQDGRQEMSVVMVTTPLEAKITISKKNDEPKPGVAN
jgi:hypothetical protein